MRTKPSHPERMERGEFGLPLSRIAIERLDYENENSAEAVIGEVGLVLVGILGIIVVVNAMLTVLHVS